jgi:hypothetical protein
MASSFGLITLGIETIIRTLVVGREQEEARVEFVVMGYSLRWPIMQFGNSGVDQEYLECSAGDVQQAHQARNRRMNIQVPRGSELGTVE